MKMKFRIFGGLAIAAVAMLSLNSCGGDPDSPGLEYMPDMYRSAAIEPYVDYGQVREKFNEEAKMTPSAKVPPFGTVPYYGTDANEVALMLPYKHNASEPFKFTHGMFEADLDSANTYELASLDANPLKLTADNSEQIFKDGKRIFESKCAHCHGKKGDGNGPMVASGAYVGVPDYANVKNLSDGQLFYSIYYGKGMMGAHKSIVNKKEIWTLVHYIRKFQDKNYGNVVEEAAAEEVTEEVVVADEEVAHTDHH